MAERLDKSLVEKGLVRTRSQSRMLIEQGDVQVNGAPAKKPGQLVEPEDLLEIMDRTLYVGRGALKLEKAIEEFQISFKELIVADIGASTGGFTQICLNAGAKKVYAIDVGKDQLSAFLKNDERVVSLEGVNAKFPLEIEEKVDAFVMDLSFISFKKPVLNALEILKPGGFGVVLIKPQFEAGRERVGKRGLVKEGIREEVLNEVRDWLKENRIELKGMVESPIVGGKAGNVEYLAFISR